MFALNEISKYKKKYESYVRNQSKDIGDSDEDRNDSDSPWLL